SAMPDDSKDMFPGVEVRDRHTLRPPSFCHKESGTRTIFAHSQQGCLPRVSDDHFFGLFRMTATEEPALWTTLFDTLPRITRLTPVQPRDPKTTRSARTCR